MLNTLADTSEAFNFAANLLEIWQEACGIAFLPHYVQIVLVISRKIENGYVGNEMSEEAGRGKGKWLRL